MGAFEGLSKSKIYETGQFLPADFRGCLTVEKCLLKKTRKSGDAFIVEYRVKSSETHQDLVGTKRSWFQSLKDTDVAYPAIKAWVYAICGYDYSKEKAECEKKLDPVVEQILDAAVEKNKLAGREIKVETTSKVTGKGVNFTRHDWFPADEKLV